MLSSGKKTSYYARLFAQSAILVAFILLISVVPAQGGKRPVVIDECWGVDHFPNLDDYPLANLDGPEGQALLSNPTWIILGFTFNLEVVPVGSELTVTFGDGPVVTGTVADNGKTFAYRGVSSFNVYQWTGAISDPNGLLISDSLGGAVNVQSGENLTCNPDALIDSPQPDTSTAAPTDTPPPGTATTEPSTPEEVEAVEPDVVVDEPDVVIGADGDGFFGIDLGVADWVYYLLLCLSCLVILAGVSVVIVIRRRRRRTMDHMLTEEEKLEMNR
ncbi:MAG: hypothetical protein IH859_00865 [Chloroflexi bacterium]|nr:hypothetical protein [Chloroflexota bacterium]